MLLPVVIFLGCGAVPACVLNRTRSGRNFYAIGGDREAAVLANGIVMMNVSGHRERVIAGVVVLVAIFASRAFFWTFIRGLCSKLVGVATPASQPSSR